MSKMITKRRMGERKGKTDWELGKEWGEIGEKKYQDSRIICNETVQSNMLHDSVCSNFF